MSKVVAITQARVGSTRLPAKILKEINGKTLLQIHLERISKATLVNELRVATTDEEGSDKIVEIADRLGIKFFKGSVNNVLDRFYQTALIDKPDYIVRLTSDCPLIDPSTIDSIIHRIIGTDYDYVSNTMIPTFPDGIDVEVFRFSALFRAVNEATLKSDHEHVTPYIWRNSTVKGGSLFKSLNIYNDIDLSSERITVDTIEDLEVIKYLIENLGDNKSFIDYVNFLQMNPQIRQKNIFHKRNEGYEKSLLKD